MLLALSPSTVLRLSVSVTAPWFQRKLTTICTICSGPSSSHLHYGAVACYSCRAFFRRGIGKSYCCVEGTGDCNIDWTCRRSCQWCRFDKSVSAGPQLKLYGKKIKIPEKPIFLNLFLFSNKILICSDAWKPGWNLNWSTLHSEESCRIKKLEIFPPMNLSWLTTSNLWVRMTSLIYWWYG